MTTEKNYRKTQLELPAEVADTFAAIGENTGIRNAYVKALRDAHWTLQSISDAAGITRERVRQIASGEYDEDLSDLLVPEPPEHIKTEPRVFVEPDPEKLARMLDLKDDAQSVRANSDKHRQAAEEYTRLIAECHLKDGVTLYRLAKRLGVSHGALRFRLARYGYKTPQKGIDNVSKVYKPIKPENRW